MKWLVVALLSCTVTGTSSARGQLDPVADAVRACAIGDAVDCRPIEERLEALLADGGTSADRAVGHKLAAAAAQIIHDETPIPVEPRSPEERVIDDVLRDCRNHRARGCNRVATVLTGLFTAADARLDASADRLLARALASRLLAITTSAGTQMVGTRSEEARR